MYSFLMFKLKLLKKETKYSQCSYRSCLWCKLSLLRRLPVHCFHILKMCPGDPRWQQRQSRRPCELLTQKSCEEPGDTPDWGKAPGRAKNMALKRLRSWKASPHHDLIKEQPACQILIPYVCRAAALFFQALHPLGCTRPHPHARPTHSRVPVPQPLRPPAPRPTPCQNTCPSAMPLDPQPLGSPLPVHAWPQLKACWDTLLSLPSPLLFRPCWTPATCGKTGPPHHPSGPAWLQLHVEWLELCPARTGTIQVWDSHIHQSVRSPIHWAEPASVLQASQITTPPGSHSTVTRGHKCA
jgi:hypothetical protein